MYPWNQRSEFLPILSVDFSNGMRCEIIESRSEEEHITRNNTPIYSRRGLPLHNNIQRQSWIMDLFFLIDEK